MRVRSRCNHFHNSYRKEGEEFEHEGPLYKHVEPVEQLEEEQSEDDQLEEKQPEEDQSEDKQTVKPVKRVKSKRKPVA